jgi:hypothetical protein
LLCVGTLLYAAVWLQLHRTTVPQTSFLTGEELEYRVHYGFINAGEATVQVSPQLYKINNKVCYKLEVFGRSTGTFDMMLRIRDTWRSYVDTTTLVPQRFYLNVQEGKYRKEETVFFDHENLMVRSEEKNEATREFKIPQNVQDIVSGYYYLRTIDFDKLPVGQVIEIKSFFDDQFYDFKVRYRGKGEVKTRFGKIRCIKLTPIMPPNQLFNGDSSIRVWLSDDGNKIPVIVEADMFVAPWRLS